MSKKTILFVGEDPLSTTGNGHMMHAILSMLDNEKYDIACFAASEVPPWADFDLFAPPTFRLIPASGGGDPWGKDKLLRVIQGNSFDALVMVGIDLWRYFPIFKNIYELKQRKSFKWAWIFPYDLQEFRQDWADWINMIDLPCVYSKYGENVLKDAVPRIRYFRPPLPYANIYRPYDQEERLESRRKLFPSIRDDQFVFGFVGPNQKRKDPQRLIKAFRVVKDQISDSFLYLHTRMDGHRSGNFNLVQYLDDLRFVSGDVLTCANAFTEEGMADVYNSIDCLVNCSMQEGLSWTPLNAMLCGTPVIASDTTAQTELVKDAGILVPCKTLDYLPLAGKNGYSWIETKCCDPKDTAEAMVRMAGLSEEERDAMADTGITRAKGWLSGISDINELLEEVFEPPAVTITKKRSAVLFIQHSSAGDVLMSTQCFKGIKEKHPGLPLAYMTQSQFQDIVVGNPYIDEIIDWDLTKIDEYEIRYNPHGSKILPGGWNSLDTKLADMYPYFCKVKADEMFIQEVEPGEDLIALSGYIVVHTSGGSPYRIYKHIDIVTKGLDLPVVQIGGSGDFACQNAIDIRGKLSWRETAWVMKRARAAICVDSFPMHLAAALDTPVIGLFGPAPARVTGPIGDPEKIICLEPNRLEVCPITAACYGQTGKEPCSSPCINSINPTLVRKKLKSLLNNNPIQRKEEAA